MNTDRYGRITVDEQEAFDALYFGTIRDLNGIFIQGNTDQFNCAVDQNADSFAPATAPFELDMTVEQFDQMNQNNWFMSAEYKNMDIESYLVHVCPKQNYQRLVDELRLYRKYNMLDLLRYLKYLVDTMRKNQIVWGLGRGSSVASYVLYLLGVHKVDSIQYNLPLTEFFKDHEGE